jgi:hydrogenase maturation factor
MSESSEVGLEVTLKSIPIRQETIEICEAYDLSPYQLISSGSLLITIDNGNNLVRELQKQGIPATVIGNVKSGNDRVILNGEERRFLERPQTDELYKV